MDKKEFCEFYEQLLKAQLSVVRQFSGQATKRRRTARKGRSQIDLTEDILKSADRPLHVTEIIKKAKEQFDAPIPQPLRLSPAYLIPSVKGFIEICEVLFFKVKFRRSYNVTSQ